MPAVGLIVLVTAAAPFMGANDGVARVGADRLRGAWLRINASGSTGSRCSVILGAMLCSWSVVVLIMTRLGWHAPRAVSSARPRAARLGGVVARHRKAMNNYGFLLQTP